MSNKDIAFYRENKAILLDFSAEQTSSDGAALLLEKIEKKHQLTRIIHEMTKEIS